MRNRNKPKVIFWDLETLPQPEVIYNVIPSIGAWPGRTFKAELQSILCFGYKILGEKNSRIINAWDLKSWKKDRFDDKEMVIEICKILSEADEIVTHNGKSFDLKVLQTRLAKYNLPPLPKIKHVDTKNVIKGKLSLYSNSLAEAAKFFNLEDKMPISNKWAMWSRFAFGKDTPKDRNVMATYCKQDVTVLEQLYLRVLPHVGNMGIDKSMWHSEMACPSCGEKKLGNHGTRMTKKGLKQRLRCSACGTSCQEDANGKAKHL